MNSFDIQSKDVELGKMRRANHWYGFMQGCNGLGWRQFGKWTLLHSQSSSPSSKMLLLKEGRQWLIQVCRAGSLIQKTDLDRTKPGWWCTVAHHPLVDGRKILHNGCILSKNWLVHRQSNLQWFHIAEVQLETLCVLSKRLSFRLNQRIMFYASATICY